MQENQVFPPLKPERNGLLGPATIVVELDQEIKNIFVEDLLAQLHVPEENEALRAGTSWRPDRAQLAAELGCTPAALKMRTHRAIARLREGLVQAGMLAVAAQGDPR